VDNNKNDFMKPIRRKITHRKKSSFCI